MSISTDLRDSMLKATPNLRAWTAPTTLFRKP
jgi:hypothetical protein